ISYFDLEQFEREANLLDVMLGERVFFYLRRINFVAQAISLYTAVESQVFHSYDSPAQPQRPGPPYDDDKIKFWACHILQQEYGIQRWLADHRIAPMMLTYEELLADIDKAIAKIADRLAVDISGRRPSDQPQTTRITATDAIAFEQTFRERNAEFCSKWERARGTAPCPL
ncbi:MAG TPA: Stf0 family sulfotransferase, partial [Stellaceae bacterium]|nr:Stf0 family sulfotransferase [Stellaceae bacterium]